MRRTVGIAGGVLALALAAGCGAMARVDGAGPDRRGVNARCSAPGLPGEDRLCMTWKLFQENGDVWELVDEAGEPSCTKPGEDSLQAYATCVVGRRVLVEYDLTLGDAGGEWAFTAVSGGGAEDVCLEGRDLATEAVIQLATVRRPPKQRHCGSHKVVKEWRGGREWCRSVAWMRPEDCGSSGRPGSVCTLTRGVFRTDNHGTTGDGTSRFVFNSVDAARHDDVAYYVAFAPDLDPARLHLDHGPWVVGHRPPGEQVDLGTGPIISFRYDDAASGPRRVGFLHDAPGEPGSTDVAWDQSADCDGPVTGARLRRMTFPNPTCGDGTRARRTEAIATGGSGFAVVYECSLAEVYMVPCDAKLLDNGLACDPLRTY